MADVAVGLVLDRLSNLLIDEVKLLSYVDREVEDIRVELEFISSFLRDADSKAAKESDDNNNNNNNGLKTWVKHIREAAFHIEDVIDEYVLHVEKQHRRHGLFKAFLGKMTCLVKGVKRRHEIASEIQDVKTKVREIRKRSQRYSLNTFGGGSENKTLCDPRMGIHFVENDALVGIDSLREDLVRELTHGQSNRTVVSVVGMGGVGKTTLAKKVADELIAEGHLDCHAWITVSQSYKVEDLLKTVLRKFYESRKEPYPSDVNAMDGEELIGKCREYLQEKSYFVVFDDVWKEDFWGDIEYALFGNDKSSRIMVTTRNMNVIEFCKRSALVHVRELKPLPLELAQELLCRIAFQFDQEKHCPLELKDLSFDIAKKCEGLPLAIVAIGGLLSTKGRDVGEWQSLNQSLKSQLESNIHLRRIKTILSFSYHDLPYHLKSCFLFLGMFPKDYAVNCARLVRLWIAEGFLKQQHDAISEEVARQYLTQLINRNLVQVEWADLLGVVRKCRVHDLMHELIVSKIVELNIWIQTSATEFNQTARHLSIQNIDSDNLPWRSVRSSKPHSIIFFEVKEFPKSLLLSMFVNFKLLKELDFEGALLDHLPEELGNLLHLKYLSVRDTKLETLPTSLGKLHKLETLDLKRSLVHQLPVEINKLSNLKFLLAYYYIGHGTRRGVKIHGKVQSLNSIEKLYFVDVDGRNGLDLVSELGKLKQLRKLGITNLKSEAGIAFCNAIEQMSLLESLQVISKEDEPLQLQSMSSPPPLLSRLRLEGRLEKLPLWISYLKCLVRIRLVSSQLSEIPLNILGELPELLELGLFKGYNGTQLHFEDGYFPALKRLILGSLDRLNGLTIDENALHVVEELVIRSCPRLKKLPSDIYHMKCVNFFEVSFMSKEFVRRMLPDVGEEHWIVQHIPNVYVLMMNDEEEYSTYKLGDSTLVEYLN